MRLIHERLMHAAVAEAAGRPVDLDVVRLALDTVMDNKYEAIELHEVALDLLSRTAPPATQPESGTRSPRTCRSAPAAKNRPSRSSGAWPAT